MKKRILIIISALMLTACGAEKESNISSEISSGIAESTNAAVASDEPYYADSTELSNAASLIFEGKVIGRHTEYIDDTRKSHKRYQEYLSQLEGYKRNLLNHQVVYADIQATYAQISMRDYISNLVEQERRRKATEQQDKEKHKPKAPNKKLRR